jgi:hypothetical protein
VCRHTPASAALGAYSRPLSPQLMHAVGGGWSECSAHGSSADLSVGSLFPCAGLGVFTRTPVWKPLACTCRCTAVCACVCVDVVRKVVRYSCSSMLTQCSPSAHCSLLTAHSLTPSLRTLRPGPGMDGTPCCRSSRFCAFAAPERKGPVLVMGGPRLGQWEGFSAPHAHFPHAGLPCESARLVLQG